MKPLTITPFYRPVSATVTAPGSKSYTNRALLMAAMTPGPVRLTGTLASDDTQAMIHCLRTLGIVLDFDNSTITVQNDITTLGDATCTLDANLSGITIRFLLALCCLIPGEQVLRGRAGLNKRPIRELVDGLRQLGASIDYLDQEGFPPVRVNSQTLTPGTVTMEGGVSSQYFSSILMIAPLLDSDIIIKVAGEQISKPYIDMTIDTMQHFGVKVENRGYKSYHVTANQRYTTTAYNVEGDVSSASYFFAIAALTKSTVTVTNLNPQSKQADMLFLGILEAMGNTVQRDANAITVIGKGVRPATIAMLDCPDQAMTMAVLSAFAAGKTTITGVQSLRVKETERVIALEQELKKMGIKTVSTHDTLTIYGGNPKPATIKTYGDHRMAMSFAVAGTMLPGMRIEDPEVVSKTFPEFWDILADITPTPTKNIVLIGMRGSGKNTIGALLAKKLHRKLIDADAEIVAAAGMSIPDMVSTHGWQHFRDQESATAQTISAQGGAIIATGGGIILRPQNVAALREHGILVLLTGEPEVLAGRTANDTSRPPLTEQPDILAEYQAIWKEREPLYRQAADITIATDDRTPESIAEEIIAKLEATL